MLEVAPGHTLSGITSAQAGGELPVLRSMLLRPAHPHSLPDICSRLACTVYLPLPGLGSTSPGPAGISQWVRPGCRSDPHGCPCEGQKPFLTGPGGL